MDKMIYLAMTGAQHTLYAQQVNANNLANIDTTGFKADIARFKEIPVKGGAFESRAYVLSESSGTDQSAGAMIPTARDLDVGIAGEGWLAVQNEAGEEAYSRNGSLQISPDGLLVNSSNQVMLGDGGAITIPPHQKIEIGIDGSISFIPLESSDGASVFLDRLKLVNGPKENIEKGVDGLYYTKDGQQLETDSQVKVSSGFLESSNVNAVEAITNMISLSRQFEIQLKLMKAAEENDETSASLLTMR
jgi:flagellar basal-body rod protein FlgF